jgi:hypothetical protein
VAAYQVSDGGIDCGQRSEARAKKKQIPGGMTERKARARQRQEQRQQQLQGFFPFATLEGQDEGVGAAKDDERRSKSKGRSRFPEGMTARKASAKARAKPTDSV